VTSGLWLWLTTRIVPDVAAGSGARAALGVAPACRSPLQHVIAELAGIGEIRHLPAIEVVFGHTILGKALEAVGIAGGLRAEQAVTPNLLGRTAIVDLIELVAPTELATDAVP